MSEILESPPEKQQFGLFSAGQNITRPIGKTFEEKEVVAGGGV